MTEIQTYRHRDREKERETETQRQRQKVSLRVHVSVPAWYICARVCVVYVDVSAVDVSALQAYEHNRVTFVMCVCVCVRFHKHFLLLI